MSRDVAANRYAGALFEIAKERQMLDKAEQDLRLVKEVFSGDDELTTFLNHPKIENEQKKQVLMGAFFQSLSPEVMNTLLLLTDRRRGGSIQDVADSFIELANEERGVADAKAYSVRPLSDEETQALSDIFAKRVGKQSLSIENIVDPSLVGGVKLRIGNRIYDGSVSGKLERIKRELVTAEDR
ncbi:F0F1 ATP synthase subunit delta [Bacillus marinisedimentorum]|uniref:F0F1 ATP synthase subunit delta n=1 Tax=Bacillus marinisedimentorum TaxID=1821260 RepID=UPI0007E2A576|nr:F0F1 ATP synthase subunit delta [Bacillus marinisedimentorum]